MMDSLDFAEIQHKFEPGASAGSGDTEPYLVSIAISLKRIADYMNNPIVKQTVLTHTVSSDLDLPSLIPVD